MRRSLIFLLVSVLTLGSLGTLAPPASADSGFEQEFLQRLNQTRTSRGLAPLSLHSGLSQDARNWSANMRNRNLLYHTPSQQMQNEIARVVPNWQRIGENIGQGYDVAGLHNAFFNSPGHRANMLGDFNRVGIGVVRNGQQTWVTFRFVKAPVSAPAPSPSPSGTSTSFVDVPNNAYYTDAVRWLARTGMTTGVGGTNRYEPHGTVTRAQMATFLWRLAGQPRRNATRFSDVPQSAYYSDAVNWMRATSLTTGVGGSNRFDPNGPVTREQMSAFLHRFAGNKAPGTRHPFVDVPRSSYADTPVSWLHRYRITTGTSPNRYTPQGVVTRAQMAAFLHRLADTNSAMGSDAIRIRV
jgi:hypothetical protein